MPTISENSKNTSLLSAFKRLRAPAPQESRPVLHLPGEATAYDHLEHWLQQGHHLATTARQNRVQMSFAIGDWYNSGVAQWGEKARKAAQQMPGYRTESVRRCGYVAARFPKQYRNAPVSWNSFLLLAPEEDQERFSLIQEITTGRLSEEEWTTKLRELRSARTKTRTSTRAASANSCSAAQPEPPAGMSPQELLSWLVCSYTEEQRRELFHLLSHHLQQTDASSLQEEPGNLRQDLTPSSPESALTTHDSRLTTEERHELINSLLAQEPQAVHVELALELISTDEYPCFLRMSRERFKDFEFLSEQVKEEIGYVAATLLDNAHLVYGYYIQHRPKRDDTDTGPNAVYRQYERGRAAQLR